MRVKICGITNSDDARVAADAGADFVGLIRAPSARQVELEAACAIAGMLPPATRPVLLYRDAALEQIVAEMAVSGCRWVQLHGREPAAQIAALREQFPDLHIIRAWEVSGPGAAEALEWYLDEGRRGGLPDIVILDAPKGGTHPGYEVLGAVSQRIAEWLGGAGGSRGATGGGGGAAGGSGAGAARGNAVAERVPEIWCAGGLTPGNVAEAAALGRYAGVDVASGVESSPGRKDAEAVRQFIAIARRLPPSP